MIDKAKIADIVAAQTEGTDLFLVGIHCTPANDVEVVMDSDSRMDIEQCIILSRAIEAAFDRDAEDFSLTVTSAGIGQPLQVLRQYRKLIGSEVELLFRTGVKRVAVLTAADENAIEITWQVKELPEGKKRKELVDKHERIPLDELKSVCEYLTIK